MRNLKCPQCEVERFFVKNAFNESLLVNVNEKYEIVPVHSAESLTGFDLTLIFCLGCSWHGSPDSLRSERKKIKY